MHVVTMSEQIFFILIVPWYIGNESRSNRQRFSA